MPTTYKTADKKTKKLAHGLFLRLSWGEWNSSSADNAVSWVERLRAANPQNGEDLAAAIVNFDWMRERARDGYRRSSPHQRGKVDAAFAFWAEAAQ